MRSSLFKKGKDARGTPEACLLVSADKPITASGTLQYGLKPCFFRTMTDITVRYLLDPNPSQRVGLFGLVVVHALLSRCGL